MNMKRLTWLGVMGAALVLTGCGAVVDSEGAKIGDPVRFAEATHVAQMSEESVQATVTAVSLQTTRTAADISAQATRTAADVSARATSSAIDHQAQQAGADQDKARAAVVVAQSETEQRAQGAALAGKSTLYLFGWAGLGVGVLVLVIGGAFAVVAWIGKRATSIYPNKQGQFPIIRASGLGWVVFHDPSRAVGPGAVYRVPSPFDVLAQRLHLAPTSAAYPLPEVSEPSLLAVSSQANAIGLTVAANRWPKTPEILARSVRLDNARLPLGSAGPQVADDPAPALDWPSRVPLRGLLAGQAPALSRLALGVTVRSDNRPEVVYGDMTKMVHVLAAGASGWGKSQFLKTIAFQLATSSEPCHLVLADLERLTFPEFAKCERLMFPIVDSERDLTAVLQELAGELARRKELFAGFGDVDTLEAYNARAGEPLAPVVLAIDEASEFLDDGNVADGIKTLARRGRKYGVWLVLGGQTFSAKDVASSTTLQFSSRVQFRAPVVSSSQTLVGDKEARALECPGRAILVLPGRAPVKVQAPFVTHNDILAALAGGGGPGRTMPQVAEEMAEDDTDAKIRLLAGDGVSRTEIARQLFGSTGGAAFYRVKRALDFTSTPTEDVEVAEKGPEE
jgi:uncharacterized protein YceK